MELCLDWEIHLQHRGSNDRLLPNGNIGKFSFNQRMQPMDCSIDKCILTAEESRCQNTIVQQGIFTLECVDGASIQFYFNSLWADQEKLISVWPALLWLMFELYIPSRDASLKPSMHYHFFFRSTQQAGVGDPIFSGWKF